MRRFWMLGGLLGLFLLGCSDAPPKPKRGGVKEPANKDDSVLVQGGSDAKLDDAGGEVRMDRLTLTAPKGWGRKTPQSTFIQAEFVLPRAEGESQDGRLTLSTAGGSVQANIDRWKDQFGGKPEKAHEEKIDVNGIAVTLVDFSGDFMDQKGPLAPGVKRSDFRMIGAIIPDGDQLHFVKAVGSKKTIESHAEKIKTFIRSAKR